jgi:hypothetical protein
MRIILFGILLLPACALAAAGFSVDWRHPSQNVDGTFIEPDTDHAIAVTRVEWGSCLDEVDPETQEPLFGTAVDHELVPWPDTRLEIPGEAGREYCVRAFTRNRLERESSESNVIRKIAR